MDEHSKVVPMRRIREVLREFEELMENETDGAAEDGPCRRCNGTRTEVIYNEQTGVTSARPCDH